MDAYLGVNLEVSGKAVKLNPKTPINKIGELGMEAELPPGMEVVLGTIGGGIAAVVNSFQDIKKPEDEFKLPAKEDLPLKILQDAYETLTTAQVTINRLWIQIPPSPKPVSDAGATTKPATTKPATTKPATKYEVGLYVSWDTPKQLVGNIKLVGFSVRFTTEGATDAAIEPPK